MNNSQASLQQLYDSIWRKAQQVLNNGGPHIDPHLQNFCRDRRLGMTLIARPSQALIRQVLDLQNRLRDLEPLQHYYRADELHITILTLFNVMDDYEPYMSKAPRYERCLATTFASMPPFQLTFQGVCASPEAVMIQGFPVDAQLQALREKLRENLHAHGLGDTLDVRYRISTAHSTIMRFSRPLQDASALLGLLRDFREKPFGNVTCRSIQWVKNDWYMSADKVTLLAEYQLKQQAGEQMRDPNYFSALQDFRRARHRADLERIVGFLKEQAVNVLSHDELYAQLQTLRAQPRPTQKIPLDAVSGKLSRDKEFIERFFPSLTPNARDVMKAAVSHGPPPPPPETPAPVELFQIGDAYFVLDGNARLSRALQAGVKVLNLRKVYTLISTAAQVSVNQIFQILLIV